MHGSWGLCSSPPSGFIVHLPSLCSGLARTVWSCASLMPCGPFPVPLWCPWGSSPFDLSQHPLQCPSWSLASLKGGAQELHVSSSVLPSECQFTMAAGCVGELERAPWARGTHWVTGSCSRQSRWGCFACLPHPPSSGLPWRLQETGASPARNHGNAG